MKISSYEKDILFLSLFNNQHKKRLSDIYQNCNLDKSVWEQLLKDSRFLN